MAKKFILTIIFSVFCLFAIQSTRTGMAFAAESYTLKAGVSMVDKVPKAFYGTWRVKSTLESSNSEGTFKGNSVDLWNLSKQGDVITLENPFSGAKASITVDEANDKLIKFKKNGLFDNKKLTDIVQLNLNGDSFSGTNYLILDTVSGIDKSIIKTERATYKLMGEKISGSSIR